MFLRFIVVVLSVLVFISCDFISPKKSTSQNEKEIDTLVNYTTIDTYPLLKACEDCETNDSHRLCFEKELVKDLGDALQQNKIKSEDYFLDTIYLDVLIDRKGKISISKIYESQNIIREIPKFDSILYRSVSQLPLAERPAYKRGIPVSAKFKLPVVITLKE